MELFFSLRCTDVPLISKLWIWCTSVWNHRQVFFFPSAKVQASQAHSQPVDVTCSHRITEQAEKALHIFALCFFMFFLVSRCKQYWMQTRSSRVTPVTRARIINGILPSSSGLPVLGKYHSEAGEMQKAQQTTSYDINWSNLIKFDQISSDLNRSQLRSTRFCTVSYWRRSQWSF